MFYFFFCKMKTAYELHIRDWSSEVCSSFLPQALNTNTRYSVEKLAIVCGPITRRGSLSPTLTDLNAGETPSRFDRIQSWRTWSTSAIFSAVHFGLGGNLSAYILRFSASAAR